jgi:predicted ATPase/DNA-binding CsgD family transcriptional regulator/ribosomal protein S18 acetylase RimI-like enzyme
MRAGLEADELLSAGIRWASRLPPRPTPLLGRAAELSTLRQLVLRDDLRLLTLTGAPGVGKTRLAVELASSVEASFPDGVIFVDLSGVTDPEQVLLALVQRSGVPEAPNEPLSDRLARALGAKRVLFLVDNFEQVIAAAPYLAALLSDATGVKMLVTSREPLRLLWEQQVQVQPLGLPNLRRSLDPVSLARHPSVALFLVRAQAVDPAFTITAENARAVAEICVRLDGLPLAIELAAARVKVLSPQEILGRLDHRLELLSRAARDVPERHRTLRAAIGWSYALLSPHEQSLFRALAVFSGSWTLGAAKAVWHGARDVVETLASLIDKSLVHQQATPGGGLRFVMLDTVREFGLEQLAATGEMSGLRRRHAEFFLGLAEQAEPELRGHQLSGWLEPLEQEDGNLRAALHWTFNGGDPQIGVRLARALWWVWDMRGRYFEARTWLEHARAACQPGLTAGLATAMMGLGHLAMHEGAFGRARRDLEQAAELFQHIGDDRGRAESLYYLALVLRRQCEYALAAQTYQESRTLFRSPRDVWGVINVETSLAGTLVYQGDYARANEVGRTALALSRRLGRRRDTALGLYIRSLLCWARGDYAEAEEAANESLVLSRELGIRWFAGLALDILGSVALQRGEHTLAAGLFEQALTQFQDLGEKEGIANSLLNLGTAALRREDRAVAAKLLRECLTHFREMGEKRGVALSFERLAELSISLGRLEEAARLFGAAEAIREAIGAPRWSAERSAYERGLATVRTGLDPQTFNVAWAGGRRLTIDAAIDAALSLQFGEPPVQKGVRRGREATALTPREREVATLVAQGLSNREIAKRLFVTENTAMTHVKHVLAKLGFHARAEIAAWAVEQRLPTLSD